MSKRLLVTLLAICLGASTLPGCTSGGAKDDAEVAEANDQQFAEEGEGDFADSGSEEGGGEATGDEPAAEGGDQALAEDAPVEDNADDLNLGDEKPKDDLALADDQAQPAPEDDLSLDDAGAAPAEEQTDVAANEPSPQVAEEPPPPTDEPVFDEPAKDEPTPAQDIAANEPPPPVEEPAAPAPVDTYEAPKAAPVYAPLLKIKEAAFTGPGGTTLNRVYLARPKDNWKSISTKVFGDATHVAELKKWNPGTSVSVGKKIYYASPSNPSDGRMLTFYEDQNIPPQTYTSQPGDNIRKVSKNLLGFNDAWREVWSTNLNVESKGNIPAGTELKYWPDVAAPTQTIAQNNVAPPTEPTLPETAPQPPPDSAMQPPPDMNVPPQPGQQAGNQLPPADIPGADPLAPPPPMPDDATNPAATGATASAEPPPPPPPPIDPKPVKKAPPSADASMDGGMDADTTMIIGLGGILLIAAAILFVVIRKNRAKRMDLGQTQV